MKNYDLSKFYRDPARAERLKKNGYKVRVTRGEGDSKEVVDEYFVSPEEVQAQDLCRRNRKLQS